MIHCVYTHECFIEQLVPLGLKSHTKPRPGPDGSIFHTLTCEGIHDVISRAKFAKPH